MITRTASVAPLQTGEKRTQSGFTLLELLVATTITLVVLGGVTQVMGGAINANRTAKEMLDMNAHLRASMDLIQRDMLQVGQGLPVGRRVGIPNDAGAAAINRPGPGTTPGCAGVTTFPMDPSLPAISVGPGVGPAVNGVCTDVLTILAADNLFGSVPLASIAADGSSAVIHDSVNITDNPDALSDNLRVGDLLMLTKGAMSVLMQVTALAGQTVTFGGGSGDPLGLNQLDPGLVTLGTINQLKADAPVDPDAPVVVGGVQLQSPTQAARIRMITYFVDTTTDPLVPRLVRSMGGGQANAVGIGVQAFRLTFDIANQLTNPTAVRMDSADLDGSGACDPDPCSQNQVRKVNILLAMTASDPRRVSATSHGRQSQNTLYTQVSLRNMAFVDRYR